MKRQCAVCLMSVVLGVGALLPGCRERYVEVSIEELEQRRPFRAVVERVYVEDFTKLPSAVVVFIGLKTETGERICLVGKDAGDHLMGFARALEKGKTYELPTVWFDYLQKYRL
jgi:hypothetical protein